MSSMSCACISSTSNPHKNKTFNWAPSMQNIIHMYYGAHVSIIGHDAKMPIEMAKSVVEA